MEVYNDFKNLVNGSSGQITVGHSIGVSRIYEGASSSQAYR
jgi:hypothetical protein